MSSPLTLTRPWLALAIPQMMLIKVVSARPVRAEQGEDFALPNFEVDAPQGLEPRGIGLRQIEDGNDRGHGCGYWLASRACHGVRLTVARQTPRPATGTHRLPAKVRSATGRQRAVRRGRRAGTATLSSPHLVGSARNVPATGLARAMGSSCVEARRFISGTAGGG